MFWVLIFVFLVAVDRASCLLWLPRDSSCWLKLLTIAHVMSVSSAADGPLITSSAFWWTASTAPQPPQVRRRMNNLDGALWDSVEKEIQQNWSLASESVAGSWLVWGKPICPHRKGQMLFEHVLSGSTCAASSILFVEMSQSLRN